MDLPQARGLGVELALEVTGTITRASSSGGGGGGGGGGGSSGGMFYLQSRSRLHGEKILKSLYCFTVAVSIEG